MAKKRKPGRPPLPKGVAKDFTMRVMVSPGELTLIDELAARYSIDRSSLVRRAIYALAIAPAAQLPRWPNEPKAYTYDPSAPRVSA